MSGTSLSLFGFFVTHSTQFRGNFNCPIKCWSSVSTLGCILLAHNTYSSACIASMYPRCPTVVVDRRNVTCQNRSAFVLSMWIPSFRYLVAPFAARVGALTKPRRDSRPRLASGTAHLVEITLSISLFLFHSHRRVRANSLAQSITLPIQPDPPPSWSVPVQVLSPLLAHNPSSNPLSAC